MKVKSILIKNMHNVSSEEIQFQDANYLYGCNGCGKSTVLQAVQLALFGYIPGQSKTNSSIFSHCNSNVLSVSAVLDVDTIGECNVTRTWTKIKDTVTCEAEFNPPELKEYLDTNQIDIPIINFSEFASMSANAVKSWFVDHVISANSTETLRESLNLGTIDYSMCEPEFVSLIDDAVNSEEPTVSGCSNLNKSLKVIRSTIKSRRDGLQSAIRTLVFDDSIGAVTEDSIETMQSRVQEVDQNIREIERKNEIYDKANNIMNKISSYDTTYSQRDVETVSNYEGIRDSIMSLSSKEAEAQRRYETAKEILVSYVQNHPEPQVTFCEKYNENCYRSDCDYYSEYKTVHEPKILELKQIEQNCKQSWDKLAAARQAFIAKSASIESEYKEAARRRSTIEVLKSEYASLGDIPVSHQSTSDLRCKLEDLQRTLTTMLANLEYTKRSKELSNTKLQLDYEVSILDTLIKRTGVNELQTELAIEPFNALASSVNEFASDYDFKYGTLAFNVSTKANSFSFGLNRDGKFITYDNLSSGERARFAILLQLYLVFNTNSNLNIIVVDDNFDHIDDDHFRDLMEDIGILSHKRDIQLILAGVRSLNNVYNIYTIDMEAM